MDEHEFDRRLRSRLQAYESKLPDAKPPPPAHAPAAGRGMPGPARVATVAALLITGTAGLLVAAALLKPTPSTIGRSGSPSLPARTAGITPVASATAAVTPAASPTAMPSGAASVTWVEGTPPDGEVSDIIRVGNRWVAGGSDRDGRAGVWISTDGLTWIASDPIDPKPAAPDHPPFAYAIHTMVDLDGQVLAFGSAYSGNDVVSPRYWRSTDLQQWQVVEMPGPLVESGGLVPTDAAVSATGDVAVITIAQLGSAASVLVLGSDGTWGRQDVTRPGSFETMSAVAATPEGFVAVGSKVSMAGGATSAAGRIWTSDDGLAWTPVEVAGIGRLNSVAWDPIRGRVMAAGRNGQALPTLLLSPDGISWSPITLADQPGTILSIGADDGLIVAVGYMGAESDVDRRLIAWSSHDGAGWHATPLAGAVYPYPKTPLAVSSVAAVMSASRLTTPSPTGVLWVGNLDR